MYREVVEDLTEVVVRFRPDGTLTFVNEVYCRLFGQTAERLVGSKWQPKAVAEDRRRVQVALKRLSPAHPVAVVENRVFSGTAR
jgi:PAS domain S-box-containing protein